MITKNKFYLKMIFTACICAIILTGCGSKYTVEEKELLWKKVWNFPMKAQRKYQK